MRVHSTDDVEEYATAARAISRGGAVRAQRAAQRHRHGARRSRTSYSAPPSFWWVDRLGRRRRRGELDAAVSAARLVDAGGGGARPRRGDDRACVGHSASARPASTDPRGSARAVAAAWTAATGDTDRARAGDPAQRAAIASSTLPSPPGRAPDRGRRRCGPARRLARRLRAPRSTSSPARPARHRRAHRSALGTSISGSTDGHPRVPRRSSRSRRGCSASDRCTRHPSIAIAATARRLTYEVTAAALARPDVQRAMLFTDADNPVSNSIYRQAGYEPRDRHVEIEFASDRRARH